MVSGFGLRFMNEDARRLVEEKSLSVWKAWRGLKFFCIVIFLISLLIGLALHGFFSAPYLTSRVEIVVAGSIALFTFLKSFDFFVAYLLTGYLGEAALLSEIINPDALKRSGKDEVQEDTDGKPDNYEFKPSMWIVILAAFLLLFAVGVLFLTAAVLFFFDPTLSTAYS